MDKSKGQNEMKRRGGKVALVVCVMVIVILAVVIGILLLRGKKETQPKRNVVVNDENAEDIAKELNDWEPVSGGQYEVTMNSQWKFADGKSPSENAYVENAVTNTNDVYFDIHLAGTEELIYSSPVLPLGSHLEDITLDEELAAGTYDCVLTYHLVDEEQNTLSTLSVSLTILIEN